MNLEFRYRGKVLTSDDITLINQLIRDNPNDSRWALSKKLCLAWNWVQPNGALRDMVCRGLMLELHRAGHIRLPKKRSHPPNPFIDRKRPSEVKVDQTAIYGELSQIRPLEFRQVRRTPSEKLFNSLIEHHHYLGYCHPVGEQLKYIVFSQQKPIACLAWSSAPRHIGSRDRFIGWSAKSRRDNIHLMAYNTRFLILPWVRVQHLASHILGRMARLLSQHWKTVYNHPLYFLETFVDKERFEGTCYKAANWIYLGDTTGRGKNDHTYQSESVDKSRVGLSVDCRVSNAVVWEGLMKTPKRINLNPDQVDDLLKRVENSSLQQSDYEIIKAMAETIHILSQAVDEKSTSIRRLLRMLFGPGTEKLEKVIKDKLRSPGTSSDNRKPKGHGRNAASDYTGADQVEVSHTTLKPRDPCPVCTKGKVYEMPVPTSVVRITGKAPLQATVYRMQKLRCNLCGETFKANPPSGIGEEKYDAASGTMIALLKYGSGMPFNRIEQLQASVGVPLPASTQWEIVEQVADRIYPVFEELKRQAAQGDVLYNDDTTIKILSLMKENEKAERKGMFTTGILSTTNDRKIVLFFTGRKHSGENMADLLKKRKPNSRPPIQMCDALSRNTPKAFKTILANCLAHGRRRFADVTWNFPHQCRHVLETLSKVYGNDKIAKERHMNPEKRLSFHQKKSGPLMKKLKIWLGQQLDQKKVEPNSGLGEAITYMLKHWKPLTLFLRMANAPLDNNLCEQALKKAILHRKNALFYKTEHGAFIGDLFMSLIHTCNLAGINPFDYITALVKHSSVLFKHPEKWLPWSYKT